MLDFDIGLDRFPNTEAGRMNRYEAYVVALLTAYEDPDAPLPIMICRSHEHKEQILDLLASALLGRASRQGLPAPRRMCPKAH